MYVRGGDLEYAMKHGDAAEWQKLTVLALLDLREELRALRQAVLLRVVAHALDEAGVHGVEVPRVRQAV